MDQECKLFSWNLSVSVQSFARTKTVYALFYACPLIIGDLSAIRVRADIKIKI